MAIDQALSDGEAMDQLLTADERLAVEREAL
jgi:hypothetical protein